MFLLTQEYLNRFVAEKKNPGALEIFESSVGSTVNHCGNSGLLDSFLVGILREKSKAR